MPINTPRIGLFKKDTLTEGTDTFNIKTMMNDNWDKLDKKVALIDPLTGKLLPGQENATEVDLSGLATKQELQTVDQKVTSHEMDYVKNTGYGVAYALGGTHALTLSPAPTAYKDGMNIVVKINNITSTNPFINVNGLGSKIVLNPDSTHPAPFKTNGVYATRYDAGANSGLGAFILQGEGGGAKIKSVQRGFVDLGGAASVIIPINAVDWSKSYVKITTFSSVSAPEYSRVAASPAGADGILLQAFSGNSQVATRISWEVVEYESGVKVQRGVVTMDQSNRDIEVSISPAALAKSFTSHSYTSSSAGAAQVDITCRLSATDKLFFERYTPGASHTVVWTVIEFT